MPRPFSSSGRHSTAVVGRLCACAAALATVAVLPAAAQAAFRTDYVRVDDSYNTAVGGWSQGSSSPGSSNTSTGAYSLYSNNGVWNSAFGRNALLSNTSGNDNTAFGGQALYSNASGSGNAAFGTRSLYANTGGSNAALGTNALFSNSYGSANTAVGTEALYSNTSGQENLGIGRDALQYNQTSWWNTAVGEYALRSHTSGSDNVAVGREALVHGTTGDNNISVGDSTLAYSTGSDNVAIGGSALYYLSGGSRNVALGRKAGAYIATGSDNVAIANQGDNGDSGTIRIGTAGTQTRAFVAGINGVAIPGPTSAVVVNSSGQLGTTTSSNRPLKTGIRPVTGDAVLSLRPVSYRYKAGSGPRQYGLIAEDVARKLPLLASYDADGTPNGVYYEQLSVLLLAQARRQATTLRDQARTLARLQHEVDRLR